MTFVDKIVLYLCIGCCINCFLYWSGFLMWLLAALVQLLGTDFSHMEEQNGLVTQMWIAFHILLSVQSNKNFLREFEGGAMLVQLHIHTICTEYVSISKKKINKLVSTLSSNRVITAYTLMYIYIRRYSFYVLLNASKKT